MYDFIKKNIYLIFLFIITFSTGFLTFLTFIDKSHIELSSQNVQFLLILNIGLVALLFIFMFLEIKKAIKIKQVLDGKGLYVDVNKIPVNPNHKDTIGYSSYFKYVLFPQRMPQIYVEKIGDKWYYSSETISKIESIYKEVYPWYVQKLENLIPVSGHKKILGIELWQFIGFLILLTLGYFIFLIVKGIAFFVLRRIQQQITKNTNLEVNKVLKQLAHPISLLVGVAFIDKLFPSLQFGLPVNTWVFLCLNIAKTVFWIYVFLKLVKVVMFIYGQFAEKTQGR